MVRYSRIAPTGSSSFRPHIPSTVTLWLMPMPRMNRPRESSSSVAAICATTLPHRSSKQSVPSFVPFLALLRLATAAALLALYRQQGVALVRGFFTAAIAGRIRNDSERLAMLLLVGTIPAAILGVFLESRIKSLFASPYVAAGF